MHSVRHIFSKGLLTRTGLLGPLILAVVLSFLVDLNVESSPRRTANNPSTPLLGIIDRKGNWIISPRFERMVYVKAIDGYWGKRQLPPLPDGFSTVPKEMTINDNWVLLDRYGHELKSQLPSSCEPVIEYSPSQAAGVSIYSDFIDVVSTDGFGECNPYGRLVLPCLYSEVSDVGNGIWMAKKKSYEPSIFEKAMEYFYGAPDERPIPPYQFLDHQGNVLSTVPSCVVGGRPQARFVNGLIKCLISSNGSWGEGAINKFGEIVIAPGSVLPPFLQKSPELPSHFYYTYEVPSSSSSAVKFFLELPGKSNPELASKKYAAPIFVTDDLALVYVQRGRETLSGLVNKDGKWVLQPNYRILAYCCFDRMIASKRN
ncbi:MAG: WG repeat-containing protein [Candidatus Obscuribacterales bacterium]|nr:WG repeat-containing protein [Candidatus Obscuribacterales bacterium]